MENLIVEIQKNYGSVIKKLFNQPNQVFWIRDILFKDQLVTSKIYESIWGRSCRKLHNDPLSWFDYLLPEDRDWLFTYFINQDHTKPYSYEYRILRKNGELAYIRDKKIPLYDQNNNMIAVAGIASDITAEQALIGSQLETKSLPILDLFVLIKTLFNKNKITKSNHHYLTEREAQCVALLLIGKTAKEIAKKLSLSPRSVEYYIESVKNKFSFNTRNELAGYFWDFILYHAKIYPR